MQNSICKTPMAKKFLSRSDVKETGVYTLKKGLLVLPHLYSPSLWKWIKAQESMTYKIKGELNIRKSAQNPQKNDFREISVGSINPCHALSADMKALKFLNFMYKEAIQHENINPEDFTGELFIV